MSKKNSFGLLYLESLDLTTFLFSITSQFNQQSQYNGLVGRSVCLAQIQVERESDLVVFYLVSTNMHAGDKTFKCDLCGKKICHSKSLSVHINTNDLRALHK